MPRKSRIAPGGYVYHVFNRSVAGLPLFANKADYEIFQQAMIEACELYPIRILAWSLMPDHWHLVVWPRKDGELSAFFRWLSLAYVLRSRAAAGEGARGRKYQGRFKCFPVQRNESLLTLCRFVERNALTARLVKRAEDWRWSSLWARREGSKGLKAILSDWPVERPRTWLKLVNTPMTDEQLEGVRICITRDRPYGTLAWRDKQVERLGLIQTVRSRGRPRLSK